MKAVFAHDTRLQLIDGNFYADGGFNDETWRRYTRVFDEVDIISRVVQEEEPKKSHKIETPGIKVHRTSQIKFFDRKMKQQIRDSDAVIARLHSFIGNRAIRIAKKLNKPYIIELVACPFEAYWYHGVIGKLVAPYMEIHTKNLVKEASYVIYVTEQYLQKRYPTEGINTNCSNVSLSEFNDKVLENRLNHILDHARNKGKYIIGTVAAVNARYKGQQFVIESLGRLKKQGKSNYEYQLVGGGDSGYLKSIAEKCDVSEQVKFLGTMAHDKVFEWLDNIDIYSQPSRQEGLPRSLIEAMSRGLPAFGAKTAGIPELLENEFIFSNTGRYIDEICCILEKFNEDILIKQAKRNYAESKKYSKDTIENRRQSFLRKFAEDIKSLEYVGIG